MPTPGTLSAHQQLQEPAEHHLRLRDYLGILKQRKKLLILPAVLIMAIAVGAAFAWPPSYHSEATILIEQQQIPSDLVRSTVTSYAGERIEIISQRVMTTEKLGKIIEDYGLYEQEREESSLATVVEGMRENISRKMISADVVDPRSHRPTTATIAFSISFSYEDPRIAQKVANELASLYLNENLKQRTQSAVETSTFLQAESDKLKEEVTELEQALAAFKKENINNLPELQQLNMQLMERAERELKDYDHESRVLEERSIYLRAELAKISPNMDMYDSDGKRIISPKDRLSELRAEYIGASSRYSEQHPDLVKMVKEIEALEKETGYTSDVKELQRELTDMEAELAMLAERYSERHPDVKKMQRAVDSTRIELQNALQTGMAKNAVATVIAADNPAYIQLQAQLHAVEAKLSSIAKARKTTKQKIAEFESRLLKSPQVEREYKDLMRDYENASSKYAEIENKQLEAELATALERENKGERFSLIEPPVIPEEPAEPDKTAIIFLGFMLAIGSSIGAVVVRESFNTAIRSPRELAAIMTVPPLIVVPYIETEKEKVEQRSKKRNILSVMLLAGVLVVVVFHLMVMPLDALWFVIMRKLGFFSG